MTIMNMVGSGGGSAIPVNGTRIPVLSDTDNILADISLNTNIGDDRGKVVHLGDDYYIMGKYLYNAGTGAVISLQGDILEAKFLSHAFKENSTYYINAGMATSSYYTNTPGLFSINVLNGMSTTVYHMGTGLYLSTTERVTPRSVSGSVHILHQNYDGTTWNDIHDFNTGVSRTTTILSNAQVSGRVVVFGLDDNKSSDLRSTDIRFFTMDLDTYETSYLTTADFGFNSSETEDGRVLIWCNGDTDGFSGVIIVDHSTQLLRKSFVGYPNNAYLYGNWLLTDGLYRRSSGSNYSQHVLLSDIETNTILVDLNNPSFDTHLPSGLWIAPTTIIGGTLNQFYPIEVTPSIGSTTEGFYHSPYMYIPSQD